MKNKNEQNSKQGFDILYLIQGPVAKLTAFEIVAMTTVLQLEERLKRHFVAKNLPFVFCI